MATGLGIDIGAESIKVVQVQVSGRNVTVTGALKLPRISEPAASADSTEEAPAEHASHLGIPDNFGEELKRAHLRRMGSVGISGREVMLKYLLTPPMPPPRLKMYLDVEIGGKIGTKTASESTYDFKVLDLPGTSRNDVVIMASVCKNDFLFKLSNTLLAAKVSPTHIAPSCFGLINAYMRTQTVPAGETVVLVDVGHELLEIAILDQDHVYFGRSAPGGGKKFTVALDKILKLGLDKAEDFKRQRAKLYPEGEKIPSKQELAFQSALKEGADNIAGAIRSSVTFCRTQTKMTKLDYSRVILSGGGARLSGLRLYLEKKIGKPVEILDLQKELDLRKLDAASAKCFEGEIPDMAVALGLAIIDADPKGAFHFSLIPEKVVRRRIFWQKTIWGIAAAIILAAGVWIPWNNAASAVAVQSERADTYADLEKKAREERKSFRSKIEENQSFAHKVDYYARQTRIGRVYLDLFTRLRAETPPDTQVTFFGPSKDANSAGTIDASGGDAVRDVVVRGHFDAETYPGTKFNDAFEGLRKKLLEIPGITNVTLAEKDQAAAKAGEKLFEFSVMLQDPSKPLKSATKATVSNPPAPGAGNSNIAQKGE